MSTEPLPRAWPTRASHHGASRPFPGRSDEGSPRGGSAPEGSGRADEARLSPLLRAGPLLLIPRRLPARTAAALDDLAPSALPQFRFTGGISALRRALAAALAGGPRWPRGLAPWLIADVVEKAELLAAFTGAATVRVRLEPVDDDRCRKFHVDRSRFRLLTTYRGPGTEWVMPRVAALLAPGEGPPSDAIRRLDRGAVALLRGERGATSGRPAVLHRSPPIAGTGIVRLLLTIDDVGRVIH